MNPLVSICCITFNHKPYIAQCLEGLINQNVHFDFEIIVNDDCSTDGTAEIIKDYASRYPGRFIPILHDQNQYSRGIKRILQTFVFPRARGKYIALCEGDDYWKIIRNAEWSIRKLRSCISQLARLFSTNHASKILLIF